MHKKPVYSFEDKSSVGIFDVPLLSIVAIERTAGLDPELVVEDPSPNNAPALVIILGKSGINKNSNIKSFISNENNWMWFHNGGLVGMFVKKEGDAMQGDLTFNQDETGANLTLEKARIEALTGNITTTGDVKADGSLWSGYNTNVGTDLIVNKYFALTDYDDDMAKGIRSYVRDGTWYINKNSGESNKIIVKIENERVLTEITGVEFHDWATPTIGGIIKARRVGNVLYMTTNGNNA